MRRYAVTALSLAVLAGTVLPAAAGQLLVVCKDAHKLAFFDADTFQPLGTAETGAGAREVAATPDGRWAFVGDFDELGNTVSMFDVRGRALKERIKVPKVWGPNDVGVSPDGRLLYITCEKSRAVAVMEIATKKFTKTFTSEMKVGHTLALVPDGSKLYVANGFDDNVTVFDTRSGIIDRYILVGDHPEGPAARPDGSEVWVPSYMRGTIYVIDAASQHVAASVSCPGGPIRIEFTPDSKKAVATCATSGRLMIFDTATRELAGSVIVGDRPFGVAVDPSGERAYVAIAGSSKVSVVDIAGATVASEFATPEGPAGVVFVK